MENPDRHRDSFFDEESKISEPTPIETRSYQEIQQSPYDTSATSYPAQNSVSMHQSLIPNPVAVAPAAPSAPQWQDRAVYPVPQNIPQLPQRSANDNNNDNSSDGKSRTLLAFLAGGLIAAFAFGIAALIFNEEPLQVATCLLYTSPSPRDRQKSRMPSSA